MVCRGQARVLLLLAAELLSLSVAKATVAKYFYDEKRQKH